MLHSETVISRNLHLSRQYYADMKSMRDHEIKRLKALESNIRFYAGAPLIDSDGYALGTLCVIDRKERELSESQKECLRALSRQVIFLMESRRRLLETNSQAYVREASLKEQNDNLENALALRAENLDYLFKSLPQIIWTANEAGSIDLCNEKWSALTGLTYHETLGNGWLSAVHPDDVNEALFKWDYSLKTETIYTNEMRFRDRAGEYRWFIVRGVPAKESRDVNTHWFGTCTDITEYKKAQNEKNELQVTAKSAMESSRLKTEFLANMSHEIRTPLNGIIGMTNLLAESTLNQEQQNFAKTIISSSKILLTLINDILDITKIEAGKLEFEQVPFDLKALLTESKINFASQFKAKQLDFKCHFDIDESLSYVGDASRIQQVINNLISNACKFTEKGSINFVVTQIVSEGAGPNLQFEIRDSGIGISNEALLKLFTNFSQADASTSRKFGGSGLGLAISRQLVEQMGGELTVESKLNVGSTFKFSLRLKSILKPVFVEPLKQKPVVENPVRGQYRILVAEDNMINQEITMRMLKKAGYRAEAVANGQEVLAAVSTITYDFLTKPLYINHLIDVLDRWLSVEAIAG